MSWSFMVHFCAPSDHYSKSYMREALFDTYGMDVEKTVGFFIVIYVSSRFSLRNPNKLSERRQVSSMA